MKELRELLTLSNVPRWAIIDTIKKQTVAEHTFRVMAIAKYICDEYGLDPEPILLMALTHDIDEAHSGDIPTPYKSNTTRPDTINFRAVKLADYIEAIIFLDRYGINACRVRDEIYNKAAKLCKQFASPSEMYILMEEIISMGSNYE